MKWVNYGDVNPIPHGGLWIKQEENSPNEYRYVELELVDHDGNFEIYSGLVDLTDSWIDWDGVNKSCDIHADTSDEHKVQSLLWYYGHSNFGSYGPDAIIPYEAESLIIEALAAYGITLEGANV